MKIKYWMTKNPVTIAPDALLTEAARIMKERGFHRLPVVEDGRLVGLVTYRQILEAQPSPVSTLSRHEARYLVAKLMVSDVMKRDPITVSPEDNALTAMWEGHRRGLGAYPVMAEGHLVGIVTSSDLFHLMAHLLGAVDRHDFVYLKEALDKIADPGYLKRLTFLLGGHGIAVVGFLTLPRSENAAEDALVLLRVSPGRSREAAELLAAGGHAILED